MAGKIIPTSNHQNYQEDEIFWRKANSFKDNPYKLASPLNPFSCLFVFPTIEGDFSREYYPIPLGYMASLVRMNGGLAEISVQDVRKYDSSKFKEKDLICFYPMVASLKQTLDLSEKVKADNPDSKICYFNSDQHQHEMILCAPGARDFARAMMDRYKSLDFILVGEAEKAFVQLCDKIVRRDSNFKDLPACFYREDRKIKLSEAPIVPVDFRFLPFSSRDYLEEGISSEGINKLSPRIQSSRGCASPCFYCAESCSNITSGGRKKAVLTRDTADFVDEIEMLQKKYGVVFFNVTDSSFEDPGKEGIKRMERFCDEIQNRDIQASFKIHLRAEAASNFNEEFLDKLKYAGVDIIGVGLESGIESELKSYKKIANLEQIAKSMHKLEDSEKFFVIAGHMMFGPILKLEDLQKKADFLESVHRGWSYGDMSDNILVFPGTAYHRFIREKGLEVEHDELMPTIPYRFEDERVRSVSEEMGKLKVRCLEVPMLQNRLFDAMNIKSRFFNKINRHLRENQSGFEKFKSKINNEAHAVEKAYISYFKSLVDLAESGYSEERAEKLFQAHIPGFFPGALERTDSAIKTFIGDCESKGLRTDSLYLKTWLSILNTKVVSVGGKNV